MPIIAVLLGDSKAYKMLEKITRTLANTYFLFLTVATASLMTMESDKIILVQADPLSLQTSPKLDAVKVAAPPLANTDTDASALDPTKQLPRLPAGAVTVEETLMAEQESIKSNDDPQTKITSNEQGFTNVALIKDAYDTALERYYAQTDEHLFWRTEALIFIAIPFSYLWSITLISLIPNFSVLAGFIDGYTAPVLKSSNFPYEHDDYAADTRDPFYIFTWANLALWPFIVAMNDIINRARASEKLAKDKVVMKQNRFYRDTLFLNY